VRHSLQVTVRPVAHASASGSGRTSTTASGASPSIDLRTTAATCLRSRAIPPTITIPSSAGSSRCAPSVSTSQGVKRGVAGGSCWWSARRRSVPASTATVLFLSICGSRTRRTRLLARSCSCRCTTSSTAAAVSSSPITAKPSAPTPCTRRKPGGSSTRRMTAAVVSRSRSIPFICVCGSRTGLRLAAEGTSDGAGISAASGTFGCVADHASSGARAPASARQINSTSHATIFAHGGAGGRVPAGIDLRALLPSVRCPIIRRLHRQRGRRSRKEGVSRADARRSVRRRR
jgi:hypothetical protein